MGKIGHLTEIGAKIKKDLVWVQLNGHMPWKVHELTKFITDLGYPFEMHKYTTTDGYINNIIRIPKSKDVGD